jgi:hypothetical protein
MPQDVRRDVLTICLGADSIQNSHYADEVAITAIGRKEKRRLLADRLRFQEIDRRLTDDANLPARLGIGEANAVPLGPHPLPLHAEHLHPSEPRQQDRADGCKSGRMLSLSFHHRHGPSKLSEFISAQTPTTPLPRSFLISS